MKNWPKIFYTVGGKIIFRTCSPFQNIPLRALETLYCSITTHTNWKLEDLRGGVIIERTNNSKDSNNQNKI